MTGKGLGVLLDIDGVLYVGEQPIPGAAMALERLRADAAGVRLLTNTTSRSRRRVHLHLVELGLDAALEEVLTPAALAVRHCREQGHARVALFVSEALREDLDELTQAREGEHADAVILGDLGSGWGEEPLNRAFRLLMDGAELVALQHNRYWMRGDGLAMDVGAYAAALEYASGREGVVVGKPAAAFFHSALADIGADRGVMVGDDAEADVGGAIAAGLAGVLVRTGKFREETLARTGVRPTAVVDSIADVPELLEAWPARR